MKIAVVGCGALGSYYGAKLLRAGEQVHFLARSDFESVHREGVRILSPEGDFHVRPACARRPQEIGPCDLVLIGLKTTANGQFGELLPPLVGPDTAVITLQNGLGNEERLAELLGASRILGGLCFVCLNRIAPGVVRHTNYGKVTLGEYQRPAQPRTHQLAELIQRSGAPCEVTSELRRARWKKLIWNVPFNGLGVAGTAGYEAVVRGSCSAGGGIPGPVLATDVLLGEPRWEALVRALMLEIIGAARAHGLDLGEDLAAEQIGLTRSMGAYRASTLIDYERGQPLELESMFLEPLRLAREAGFPAPRLAALCEVLRQLDPAGRQAGG